MEDCRFAVSAIRGGMTAGIFALTRLPMQFKTNLYHRGHRGTQREACATLVFLDSQAILPVRPEEPGYSGY
jgi:hypothetical protein